MLIDCLQDCRYSIANYDLFVPLSNEMRCSVLIENGTPHRFKYTGKLRFLQNVLHLFNGACQTQTGLLKVLKNVRQACTPMHVQHQSLVYSNTVK